jgi:hypothetical protein
VDPRAVLAEVEAKAAAREAGVELPSSFLLMILENLAKENP